MEEPSLGPAVRLAARLLRHWREAGHTPYPSLGPWIQDCCCLLFEGCEAFLLEPRCWDSGTQSSQEFLRHSQGTWVSSLKGEIG
eukprot:XP_017450558.1 PREDICTED: guanine nucleotide-binding protein G(I)/G(S)/G(O) subunit gamma-7 isoform X1 [Rattus norvegicus]